MVKPVQDADLLCSTGKFVRHGFVFMHWEHQCEVLSHFQVSRQPLSKGREEIENWIVCFFSQMAKGENRFEQRCFDELIL